jgi:hypothetical protein
MGHGRAPGVKHRGDADAGAEVLGIGRDGSHGLGRGREQDVVDHGLVLIGDVRDGYRQRKHRMKVRHRQQIGLARGEPLLGGRALTLRTMAITTAVVSDDRVRAIFAARHMAAERRRTAALDRTHHLHLVEADVTDIGTPPRRSVVAEDIRDLQHRARHDRGPLRRRLVFAVLLGLLARLRQQVERALDASDHAGGDAGVARCRVQFVVPQQRLDDANIGATFK